MTTVPTNPVRLNLFGRWLAGVRANLGYTQFELSRQLNLNEQTVGKWEGGQLPRAGILPQTTRVLGVNLMQSVSRHFAAQLANEPYAAVLLRSEIQQQISALPETSVNVVPLSNAFGSALKMFRERRGLTLEAASKDLDIAHGFLRALELGDAYPSEKMLQILAAYYQREPQELAVLLIASRMTKNYRDLGVDFAAVCRQAAREARTRVITIQQSNIFGETLQTWREAEGIDQIRAADDLSIVRTYLSAIETGRATKINVELLERITRYYNKEISEVFPLLLTSQAVKKYKNVTIDFSRVFEKAAEASKSSVTRVKRCNALGETLRRWREECGCTQSQIASALGLSDGTISCLESGKLFPSPETIRILSEHYGKDLSRALSLHFLSQTVQQYGSYSFDFRQLLQRTAERAEQGCFNPLGELLKIWRLESGLTQIDVDRNSEVSYRNLSRWENGRIPNLDSLKNVANFYGKNLLDALPSLLLAQAMQQYQALSVDIPMVLRQAAAQSHNSIIEVLECDAFGDLLQSWRNDLGKTMKQVAAELGVSEGEISGIERGQYLSSFSRLQFFANYYQRDFNEAFPLLLLTETVKDYPTLPLNFEQVFQQAARIARTSVAEVQTSYALGDAFSGWRNERGKTLTEIGVETGISDTAISALEAGKALPERETFLRFVQYFGKDLAEAFSILILTETVQEYGALKFDFSEVFEQVAERVEATLVHVQTTNATGDLLTGWREQRGERREDVSSALKISLPCLIGIELGREVPSFPVLMALVQHYEKSIEQIIPSYVISSAIRQYAFMNLNLSQLLQTTLEILPQGLQLGVDENAVSGLLSGGSNLLGDKLRQLIQQSGIYLQDQAGLQNLARECGIEQTTFIDFLQGNGSLADFLASVIDRQNGSTDDRLNGSTLIPQM